MRRRPNNPSHGLNTALHDDQLVNKSSSSLPRKNDDKLNWLQRLLVTLGSRREKIVAIIFVILCLLLGRFFFNASLGEKSNNRQQEQQNSMDWNLTATTYPQAPEAKTTTTTMTTTKSADKRTTNHRVPSLLVAEDLFLKTMRSSFTGVQEQQANTHTNNNIDKQQLHAKDPKGRRSPPLPVKRIGILAPPGYLSTIATKWIREHVLQIINLEELELEGATVTIFSSSNVPPYGYGKNHGWDKIIRLTTVPAMLGVMDMMLFSIANEITNTNTNSILPPQITVVLRGMLRQYVRWHCRLSHVAAHTAVYTVYISPEIMLLHPKSMIENATNFIFPHSIVAKTVPILVPESEKLILSQHVQRIELFAAADISNNKKKNSDDDCPTTTTDEKSYRCILQEELDSTNQLQNWPCKSFWENIPRREIYNNKDSVTDTNVHEFFLFQMASRLGPSCLSEHVKCTINQDLCEEAIDLSLCTTSTRVA